MAVFLSLIAGVTNGFGPSLTDVRKAHMGWLWELSYGKHAAEAMMQYDSKIYASFYDLEDVSDSMGYNLNRAFINLSVMLAIGTVMRAATFVLMIALNREKQK
jgi:hypothetical protein